MIEYYNVEDRTKIYFSNFKCFFIYIYKRIKEIVN